MFCSWVQQLSLPLQNDQATNGPADMDSFRQTLSTQGALVGQHSQALREVMAFRLSARVTQMGAQLDLLVSHATASPPATVPPPVPTTPASAAQAREPFIPAPERYAGDMGMCRAFLIQCSLVFDQQPLTYPIDRSRIAFILGSLRGNALAWASALWDSKSPACDNFDFFVAEMRTVFDHPVEGGDAAKRLMSLRQGSRSVAEFSVEFRTVAVNSGWNDQSLRGLFLSSLNESIKDELATRDEADSLEEVISLSIRLDNRLCERRRKRVSRSMSPAFTGSTRPSSSPVGAGGFLLPRKISPFAPVSTSVVSIISPLETSMLCPSSVPCSSLCRVPLSFQNWTYAMHTTWCVSVREMSGRLPLTLPLVTSNTWSCPSV